MPSTLTEVQSPKADKYMNSLCKHFARKVKVERDAHHSNATVHFPMGCCHIRLSETQLQFECVADSEGQLNVVREIVDLHIIKLGDFRGLSLHWTAPADEPAPGS
ncbi:DUF2218 domain-containing protein [Granulosicoccaceae sp. 1_MG-2023]|nr:DUF2218 domain-containing protein [Granulosicoccaceae sp. 1_MG-2023]